MIRLRAAAARWETSAASWGGGAASFQHLHAVSLWSPPSAVTNPCTSSGSTPLARMYQKRHQIDSASIPLQSNAPSYWRMPARLHAIAQAAAGGWSVDFYQGGARACPAAGPHRSDHAPGRGAGGPSVHSYQGGARAGPPRSDHSPGSLWSSRPIVALMQRCSPSPLCSLEPSLARRNVCKKHSPMFPVL